MKNAKPSHLRLLPPYTPPPEDPARMNGTEACICAAGLAGIFALVAAGSLWMMKNAPVIPSPSPPAAPFVIPSP